MASDRLADPSGTSGRATTANWKNLVGPVHHKLDFGRLVWLGGYSLGQSPGQPSTTLSAISGSERSRNGSTQRAKQQSQCPLRLFQRLRQLFGDLGLYNCAAIVPAAVPATVPAEARRAVRGNVRQLRLSRRQRGRTVGKRGGCSGPPMLYGKWLAVRSRWSVAGGKW